MYNLHDTPQGITNIRTENAEGGWVGEKDLTPRARLKLAPPTITQPGGVAPRSLTLFIFNINMYLTIFAAAAESP